MKQNEKLSVLLAPFAIPLFCVTAVCTLSLAPASAADEGHGTFTHTLYLVRHGAYNQGAKVDPQVGGSLTPLGIAEARLLAVRLRSLPLHFDSATSSTMNRAKETAAVVAESLPELSFKASSDLSECSPPAFRALEGESLKEQQDCAKRLDRVFSERFAPPSGADWTELVIAHGNVIRYLVTKALGVDTHVWPMFSVAHTSLTVIRVRADGTMSVLAVGDVGHIPPNLQSWGSDADPQLAVPRVSTGGP